MRTSVRAAIGAPVLLAITSAIDFLTATIVPAIDLFTAAVESLVNVKRDQVASKRVLGSAMPAGLTAAMSRGQLLDLIRYLSSLGGETKID